MYVSGAGLERARPSGSTYEADSLKRQQRAEAIGQLIDPQGTLPPVELALSRWQRGGLDAYGSSNARYDILSEGVMVGGCMVSTHEASRQRYFNGIELDEDSRGRGIGMATYKTIIQQALIDGYEFRTQWKDCGQSERAKRIWELLAARGVALEVEKFVPMPAEEGVDAPTFVGHYAVPAMIFCE